MKRKLLSFLSFLVFFSCNENKFNNHKWSDRIRIISVASGVYNPNDFWNLVDKFDDTSIIEATVDTLHGRMVGDKLFVNKTN